MLAEKTNSISNTKYDGKILPKKYQNTFNQTKSIFFPEIFDHLGSMLTLTFTVEILGKLEQTVRECPCTQHRIELGCDSKLEIIACVISERVRWPCVLNLEITFKVDILSTSVCECTCAHASNASSNVSLTSIPGPMSLISNVLELSLGADDSEKGCHCRDA